MQEYSVGMGVLQRSYNRAQKDYSVQVPAEFLEKRTQTHPKPHWPYSSASSFFDMMTYPIEDGKL